MLETVKIAWFVIATLKIEQSSGNKAAWDKFTQNKKKVELTALCQGAKAAAG